MIRISHHSHTPSSSSDFTKLSFYEVGGSQTTPKFRLLNLKEVKQFIEILFHTGHGSRISLLPARGEVQVSLSRLAAIGSVADTVQGFLNRWLIVLFHFVQHVSCLMSPTAVEQDLGEDDL